MVSREKQKKKKKKKEKERKEKGEEKRLFVLLWTVTGVSRLDGGQKGMERMTEF